MSKATKADDGEYALEAVEGRLGSLLSRFLKEQETLYTSQHKQLKAWMAREMKALPRESRKALADAANAAMPATGAGIHIKGEKAAKRRKTSTSSTGTATLADDPDVVSGYLLFSKEWRATHPPGISSSGTTQTIAAAWKKVSPAQKAKFSQEARQERQRSNSLLSPLTRPRSSSHDSSSGRQ